MTDLLMRTARPTCWTGRRGAPCAPLQGCDIRIRNGVITAIGTLAARSLANA